MCKEYWRCGVVANAVSEGMVVGPSEGRVTVDGPVGVIEKVHGRRTNGVISIVEHPVTPGVLVPPHVHTDFDEWSYVLEGRVGARIGDDEFTAGPGSYILKPRGSCIRSGTPGPIRYASSRSSRPPDSR